jgi:hypothetical protein
MFIKLSGRVVFSSAVVALLVLFMPNDSGAQSMDVFVGLRGGLASSSSPVEVSSNHHYPPSYTSTYSPTAWGATAGVIVNDKFEFRVEAARYRFHYTAQSTTPYPISSIKSTWVTDAHAWQFPVLVSYSLNAGSFRTLVGGGISLRSSLRGTMTTTTTTIHLPNPTETTTVSTSAYEPAGPDPVALHASLGFELRKGWISLRPEMRLGFWSGYRHDPENQVIGSSIQAEFIVGVRLHPFKTARSFHP